MPTDLLEHVNVRPDYMLSLVAAKKLRRVSRGVPNKHLDLNFAREGGVQNV